MTEQGKKWHSYFRKQLPSHGDPDHSRGRPHSIMGKSQWTGQTGKPLGRYRLKLSVWLGLCVLWCPTLWEVTVLQSILCQISFCIQLNVRAKKLCKLACNDLCVAAAILQLAPQLFHLYIASLTCSSGVTALHWKLWCRFIYKRVVAAF